MQTAIVNSQLHINNIAVRYVPNSLKFDLGLGEQDVKATAGGGGSVESVYFNNVESNIGCVKFVLYTTNVELELHKDWKSLGNANAIQITAPNGITVSYAFMAQTNLTDNETGNAQTTSFEFKGEPAIS